MYACAFHSLERVTCEYLFIVLFLNTLFKPAVTGYWPPELYKAVLLSGTQRFYNPLIYKRPIKCTSLFILLFSSWGTLIIEPRSVFLFRLNY